MEKNQNDDEINNQLNLIENPDNYLRIALVGNVDSGKSTLVGVLTKGLLDDGRGSSREKVFNYPHETQTGRTSSIAHEIMGFDENNNQIFPKRFNQKKNKYWNEIMQKTKKLINLIDLCGHEKYLKTTMLGMVGLVPDYILIVVGANFGLSRMTKEHLGIALALEIPFLIVITKIDLVPNEVLQKTIQDIKKILKAGFVNKKALMIQSENQKIIDIGLTKKEIEQQQRNTDVQSELDSEQKLLLKKTVNLIKSNVVCPIFQVSSLTGQGINILTKFISQLESRTHHENLIGKPDDPVEFDIHENFEVQGTGLVVSGLLRQGKLISGNQYILGPDKENQFSQVIIKSLHIARVEVQQCFPGVFCTANIRSVKKKQTLEHDNLRKGIILLSNENQIKPIWSFEAQIAILHHSSTITKGYEAVMHCGVIRQTVKIIKMQKECLRTGDKDILKFQFVYNSEYLKVGQKFLLREGRTKIMGLITGVMTDRIQIKDKQFLFFKKSIINSNIKFVVFQIFFSTWSTINFSHFIKQEFQSTIYKKRSFIIFIFYIVQFSLNRFIKNFIHSIFLIIKLSNTIINFIHSFTDFFLKIIINQMISQLLVILLIHFIIESFEVSLRLLIIIRFKQDRSGSQKEHCENKLNFHNYN